MDSHTLSLSALILLCAVSRISSAPVDAVGGVGLEDPVAKLEELKSKLQDLNHNIDTYVEAEKHAENEAGHKRSSVADQQGAASDPALDDFVQTLSPNDKVLLEHMKTKVQFLQAALHEPHQVPNPGENAPDDPQQPRDTGDHVVLDVPQEKRDYEAESAGDDQALQDFMAGLSPQDMAVLKQNKDKVKFLQEVLHEPEGQVNPGEASTDVEARELSDSEIQEALHSLSPEDQKVLLQNAAKAKLLVAAMHETPHANEGEQVDARELEDADLQEALQQLSPEDKQVLMKNKAKAKLLLAAMHETPEANLGEEVDARELEDADLQEALQQLSPEDKQVLMQNKAKAKLLVDAMHEAPHVNQGEEVEARELEDADLQEALQQLSPQDKAVLLKNKGKAKLLLAAMHEIPHANAGEENVGTSEAKREQSAVAPPMRKTAVVPPHLPPGPAGSVHQSHLPPHRAVGQEPAGQGAPGHGTDEEVVFTAADRQLLKTVQAKLEKLQASLEAFREAHPEKPSVAVAPKPEAEIAIEPEIQVKPKIEHPTVPEVQAKDKAAKVDKKDHIRNSEGHFGKFVSKRDGIAWDAWFDEPVAEDQLGIDKKCVGENCAVRACVGEECGCIGENCDKPQSVDKKCEGGDCECRGENCQKPVNMVNKRVLSDSRPAHSNGVNFDQLLNVLSHVKANAKSRRLAKLNAVERELDGLRR